MNGAHADPFFEELLRVVELQIHENTWIDQELDSVKDRIETDIYDQLKRIEEDVIDLHSYSQFPIIDR